MIDKSTLNSLIVIKRNNVVSMLNHLKSHEGNATDNNIDELLSGYNKATNDMLSGNVKDNLFTRFNYFNSSSADLGYMEAVSTILGVIMWEKERGKEEVEGKECAAFDEICDTFDKIFYLNK